ncbi:calcium-binding protein [Albimonas sp. CAU 1670]|uniref:calcium-binding protein n=1 Tax=Albimonas sp. CAU 1670 TaxID=3032599 RepID=UPI0023DABF08|nr:calcium-binding protein [Albimonas sp. CAU 1670]MDF2233270.1 calcium-binding protein [Albimonas sp. CAU 1670]
MLVPTLSLRADDFIDMPAAFALLREIAREEIAGGAVETADDRRTQRFETGDGRAAVAVWPPEDDAPLRIEISGLPTDADGSMAGAVLISGEGLAGLFEALAIPAPGDPTPPSTGEGRAAAFDAWLAAQSFEAAGGRRFDILQTGAGDDAISGGDRRDVVYGSQGGEDVFDGGRGNDVLVYRETVEASLDPPTGGVAVDLPGRTVTKAGGAVDRFASIERLILTGFDDVVEGGRRKGAVNVGMAGGDDVYRATAGGVDLVIAGDGADLVATGQGSDVVYGGAGDDRLRTGADRDRIDAGEGDDAARGGRDNDVVDGGGGDDRLFGGAGHDHLSGEDGADRLVGGRGKDVLRAGGGDDLLFGGFGADKMLGGKGADRYDGGGGADVLLLGDAFRRPDGAMDVVVLRAGDGRDVIRDMALEEDRFALEGLTFAELSFVDAGAGAEIRAGDEALAVVRGIAAADLDDAGLFL